MWNSRLDNIAAGCATALQIMRRMAQTMVPRGPDSGGFYTDDNCALAHRRLSVIDPARSAQPMTRKTALDSYTIVYNGELYNTAEIRSELESTGISFTSSGDTEVLLWAYITWGDAFNKLNGIYAFAVWQERKNSSSSPVTESARSRCFTTNTQVVLSLRPI